MKYCENCNYVVRHNAKDCPNCKKNTIKNGEPERDFPVVVVRATGFEKERICASLGDENIPYSIRIVKKKFSTDAVTGSKNAYYDIMVPYEYYADTMNLLIGINAVTPENIDIERLSELTEKQKKKDDFDGENYYSTKNKMIRIVSVVVFLALVAIVVFGVDAIMALIKGFLS